MQILKWCTFFVFDIQIINWSHNCIDGEWPAYIFIYDHAFACMSQSQDKRHVCVTVTLGHDKCLQLMFLQLGIITCFLSQEHAFKHTGTQAGRQKLSGASEKPQSRMTLFAVQSDKTRPLSNYKGCSGVVLLWFHVLCTGHRESSFSTHTRVSDMSRYKKDDNTTVQNVHCKHCASLLKYVISAFSSCVGYNKIYYWKWLFSFYVWDVVLNSGKVHFKW